MVLAGRQLPAVGALVAALHHGDALDRREQLGADDRRVGRAIADRIDHGQAIEAGPAVGLVGHAVLRGPTAGGSRAQAGGGPRTAQHELASRP